MSVNSYNNIVREFVNMADAMNRGKQRLRLCPQRRQQRW